MKTIAFLAAAALAVPLSILAGNLSDGSARGGAALLITRNASNVATVSSVEQSHGTCSDCRNISGTAQVRDGKMGQVRTVATEKHMCGDCRTSSTTTGHGKTKQATALHTCSAAAQPSNCCVK